MIVYTTANDVFYFMHGHIDNLLSLMQLYHCIWAHQDAAIIATTVQHIFPLQYM